MTGFFPAGFVAGRLIACFCLAAVVARLVVTGFLATSFLAAGRLITERRVSQPWGLQGGEPGAVGENWLLPGGYERLGKRLPDKCTFRLKAGDVIRMLSPGGGGWGPPEECP